MELIERETQLAQLTRIVDQCDAGMGQVVLLSGEAGIGKSSLLRAFAAALGSSRDVWWGHCDPLETPNPLGPLHDMAAVSPPLASLLRQPLSPIELFSSFLRHVQGARNVVLVFEDAHWADQSTLDLILYLGRRIDRTQALLVVSFRDDELPIHHALRAIMGELPAASTARIELPRLSEQAVATLARRALRSPAGIHAATAGNPFFVTEILRHGAPEPTRSVEQLVLGRMARLPAGARKVVQLVSIVPGRAEKWLVEQIVAPGVGDLDDALDSALIELDEGAFRFRHEIARVAIERSLSPVAAEDFHRRVLEALERRCEQYNVLSRLVHHAVHARDKDAVLRLAPIAARGAQACGARREAAAYFRTSLQFADGLPVGQRLALLESYADECRVTDQVAEAIRAREERARLLEAGGDPVELGDNYTALALVYVAGLRNPEADAASRRAIEILEAVGPGRALAAAYAGESHLRMLNRDIGDAISWGRRALQLARQYDAHDVLAVALGTVGAALLFVDYEAGRRELAAAEITAREHDQQATLAKIQCNMGSGAAELFDLSTAERDLQRAIETASTHQNDLCRSYSLAWLAFVDLYRGRWEDARMHAQEVMECAGGDTTPSCVMALCAAGKLGTRRGDASGPPALDQALELAIRTDTMQRLVPVHAARAEAALLRGDVATAIAEAEAALPMALRVGHAWYVGDLALTLFRADGRVVPTDRIAKPYAHEIAGRWEQAADEWRALSCPYEQARALSQGDEAARFEALGIFESLGATPAAEAVRRLLRADGVRGVPRGPRVSTQRNPLGLTNREMEIATLLGEGLRNSEIAERLYRSVRTIENHVDSILDKLKVRSRAEVQAVLEGQGMLQEARRTAPARARRATSGRMT